MKQYIKVTKSAKTWQNNNNNNKTNKCWFDALKKIREETKAESAISKVKLLS